jgi:oligopeptide transport system substrate-binding protein
MRRKLLLLPTALVLVNLLTLGGLPVTASQAVPGDHVLRVDWGDFPETLDPQHSDQGQWSLSGGLDYEGLTRIDEELQVVPGAAESWEFSPDGKTITFHLRDGLVYSDGVPVVAAHFVYAAERLCSPALNSLSVDLLADVIGCMELFHAGSDTAAAARAKAEFGVRALDDRTLEYRFTRPAPYFLVQASNWCAIPLRQELVEAGGPEWWSNPATRIGNGPFKLVQYQADEPDPRVRYARNEHYWRGRTKLDELDFRFLDTDPALAAYRYGDIDVIFPGDENIPALEADSVLSRELVTIPDAGTFYYIFNVKREPFQDRQVRRAFAAAFDRGAYCRVLKFSSCTPTLSMIPPGMPAAIETDANVFDPEKARQALAASSYGGPERLPEIDRHEGIDDPAGDVVAKWLYEQFRQVLGVELKRIPLAEEDYGALFEDPATVPQFHSASWFAGLDPLGWFTIWRCDSTFNDHGYCNPELDALLDRADAEMDSERRIALYEQAGQILVADAPAIFVSNVGTTWLVKSSVTGYTRTTGINGDWPGWMNLMTIDVERPK